MVCASRVASHSRGDFVVSVLSLRERRSFRPKQSPTCYARTRFESCARIENLSLCRENKYEGRIQNLSRKKKKFLDFRFCLLFLFHRFHNSWNLCLARPGQSFL